MPAIRKVYRDETPTKDINGFYILEVNGVARYVIAHKKTLAPDRANNDIWNIAGSGAILDRVIFYPNRRGEHPNDPNLGLFDETLTVLQEEMKKAGY